MSKVETQVTDVKALALRCKALEMQLRQSVPKKDHVEITSKLERQITTLEKDLDRARTENQKTISINKQITGVESQIGAVIRATSGLAKALDSLDSTTITTRKALAEQARTIDSIGAKIAQGTVPSGIHIEGLSKIRNLESKCEELTRQIGHMVPSREYVALNDRFEEANRKIGTMVPASDLEDANSRIAAMVPATELEEANARISAMVPASDYAELKRRTDDLENTISTMAPQLAASEARVGELEGMLAYRVPQTVYDELVSKVVSFAEAITGGAVKAEEAQPEAVEAELPTQAVSDLEVNIEAATPDASAEFAEPDAVPQPEVVETIAAEPPAQTGAETQPEVIQTIEAPVAQVAGGLEATNDVSAEQATPEAAEPSPQVDVPVTPAPSAPENPVPEIREVASQLAEINSQAQEAKGADAAIGTPTAEPPAVVAPAVAKDAPTTEPIAQETTSA